MDDVSRIGTRLTTTATTGWTDWFHGALWLFSDGILRVPIGRIKSVCFVGYMAERHNPLTKVFSIEDFHTLLANPRNLWIPRADITSASLHYSPRVVYELHVQMADGRALLLLTLPFFRIYRPLQVALQDWLGEAFESDARSDPFGRKRLF